MKTYKGLNYKFDADLYGGQWIFFTAKDHQFPDCFGTEKGCKEVIDWYLSN